MIRKNMDALTPKCPHCDATLYESLARCPECRQVRPEFEEYESLIQEEQGHCVFSGGMCNVMLPNGDYIWTALFWQGLQDGWFESDLSYSERFYSMNGHLRPKRS